MWATALSFDDMVEDVTTVDSDGEESLPGHSAEPEHSHGGSLSLEDTIDVRGSSEAADDSPHAPGTSCDLRDASIDTDATEDGAQVLGKNDGGGSDVHKGGSSKEADPQHLRSTPPEVSAAEVLLMRSLLSRKDGL